ncbi:MAG: iron-containing alcohol dehydrogenase, partial [Candidatus Geothermarchaeales archaeon]
REETGEYFGEYAAQLVLMGADLAIRNAEGIGRTQKDSVRTLVEALISDGVAAGRAGSSRPCSGSEHLFSHALDLRSRRQALHGEQCGVGAIMLAHLHGLDDERIRAGLKAAGAPTNASELGVDREDLVEALVVASELRPERYTILNRVHLTPGEALDLARTTGVI